MALLWRPQLGVSTSRTGRGDHLAEQLTGAGGQQGGATMWSGSAKVVSVATTADGAEVVLELPRRKRAAVGFSVQPETSAVGTVIPNDTKSPGRPDLSER